MQSLSAVLTSFLLCFGCYAAEQDTGGSKTETRPATQAETKNTADTSVSETGSGTGAPVPVPGSNASGSKSEAENEQPESEPDEPQAGRRAGRGGHLSHIEIGKAQGDWLALLREHIPELSANAEPQNVNPAMLRKLRRDVSNILATEGYFSPTVDFDTQVSVSAGGTDRVIVNIEPGPRTIVQAVSLNFSGALADAAKAGQAEAVKRRDAIVSAWGLPQGAAFRDDEWSSAKNAATENLRADTYASATIVDSKATVDAENQSAALQLELDSGPPFTLGEVVLSGFVRYPPLLVDRYNPPRKGEKYSRARLLEFQRALQNSPYFSTVAVSVDPDPAKAENVPVEVNVVERRSRDLGFGVGYSTNTGYRSEVSYRDRDLLDKAWDMRSAVRLEQRRQLAYADVYLPPRDGGYLDSFGVLADRANVSGLLLTRTALGVKRTSTHGHLEQRLGFNLSRERAEPDGEDATYTNALVGTVGWTWRDVDDSFAPRKGQIYQLDFAISEKALISDQRFIRVYGKHQRWIPIGKQDGFVLRAEVGEVFSPSIDGVPEDYLFRIGGSNTVRGYSYQSIGINQGTAVTGGRVMTAASAEYVHWLKQSNWGSAVFMDVGGASDTWKNIDLKQGYGVGARYKTPAGPIALDLAYGKQARKVRLDFSIAIAF
ncbi:autotransporter assembly complex protein TamA [Undibacterium terreum]|uniref:Outer membrane protein assembly factor n=1 Tax=Undibacterium terreum TaxID=1224302 RepID=A0A916UHI6_9BURK|nr:BamA/TamA family outer membrane protein [Undibacterium terreum]GGC71140.1 outer membrane protein assembly factor [Undibacterium terreum]